MPQPVRTLRVSDTIVKRIKRQLASGKLTPGHKLPAEREMAKRYKTSRVSVREAYRSLEELGVLAIRRGADGGAFISAPGHDAVQRSLSLVLGLGRTSHQELTEARLMIEPPIARLASRRAGPDDIAKLRLIVERQEAALAREGHFRPHSLLFHRAVAECAGNLPLRLEHIGDVQAGIGETLKQTLQRSKRAETMIPRATAGAAAASAHSRFCS